MTIDGWNVNLRPIPRSTVVRWASPIVWNRALRNCEGFLTDYINSHIVTDETSTSEARENIRAAMTMIGMEAEANG